MRAIFFRFFPLLCVLLAGPAHAHVGTETIFLQGNAGPYVVYVTVAPPAVVPGEAQVSVICENPGLRPGPGGLTVSVQANVLGGSQSMPEPQPLTPSPGTSEFHGTVWLMTQGSWQVRVTVRGDRGEGFVAVPVPAEPTRLRSMSRPLGALLLLLGALLIAGLGAIAAAFVREAQQEPGAESSASLPRRASGRRAALWTVAGCLLLLGLGDRLWRQEVARYRENIYLPLEMRAAARDGVLDLHLKAPAAVEEVFSTRRLNDLVLDHNHLMHLYAVRWPEMDEVLHLHPQQISAGEFRVALPELLGGEYRLFADVVHADGVPETAVATLRLPDGPGQPLTGDDTEAEVPGFGAAAPEFRTADGFRYRLEVVSADREMPADIAVNRPVLLRFTLLTPEGKAPGDMRDYMGMAGHLGVVKQDGSVFAHIHPNGSAPMAAYMLANQTVGAMPMPARGTNVASFPFGFPSAGRYRLIIQMRHGDTIETGVEDIVVR